MKEERISLSIVFRINTASTNLTAEEEDLTVTTDSTNTWGSLDLIIPSHNDYELLISTLNSLIELNQTYKTSISRDVLLLQQQWTDLGKKLSDPIYASEWTTLCLDRLSVPVRKAAIVSLYKKFCTALDKRGEEGIPLANAVGLLEHTRKLSLHMENKVDPCDVVWNILMQHNLQYENMPVYDSDSSEHSTVNVKKEKKKKKKGADQETVTAAAFLKFLQAQQKNSKVTIQQVKDLFERLNSIATASQISEDGKTRKDGLINNSFSRELITKAVCINFILSDSNDAFDPVRGQWENDDMSQPLCSYWINSSHDTYLCDVPPAVLNSKFDMNLNDCSINVKMYATALYRGCRCLDVDVWDGQHKQKGQPVIKIDSVRNSSGTRQKLASTQGGPSDEPIAFSEVLWLVRSFLLSNPHTLPVILCIETRCSLSNQEKMADDIKNILQFDEMVYMPNLQSGDTLPSPDTMRGKVVLKFKIADGTQSALFDDYDEDIDVNLSSENRIESELGKFGIETVKSSLNETFENGGKSAKEMELETEKAYLAAKEVAKKADDKAFDTKVKANRQKQIAKEMLKNANLTTKDAEKEIKSRLGKTVNKNVPLPTKLGSAKPGSAKPYSTKSSTSQKDDNKKGTWTSFFFGGKDSVDGIEGKGIGTEDPMPFETEDPMPFESKDRIETEELREDISDDFSQDIGPNETQEEDFDDTKERSTKGGLMTRMLEWGDSDYSDSDDSDEFSDDEGDDDDVDDRHVNVRIESYDESRDGRMSNQRVEQKNVVFQKRNNRPGTGEKTEYSRQTNDSDTSDGDHSEDWIDSTPEFRQYQQAAKKKIEIDEYDDIKNVERKLQGFREHKELEEGIEVEHYFSSTVDHALIGHSEAERKHTKAAEIVHIAAEVLKNCQEEFNKSNDEFNQAKHDAKIRSHEALTRQQEAEKRKKSKIQDIQKKRIQELRAQKLKSKNAQDELESINQRLEEASLDLKLKKDSEQELKEQVECQSLILDETLDKLSTAKTVRETAISEAQISADRVLDVENQAKAAQEKARSTAVKAQEETKLEEEASNVVLTEEKVCNEVNKNFKASKQKWQVIVDGLERVKRQIREIERSSAYRHEMKEIERGNLEDGKMRKQHKMKQDEKYGLEDKLKKVAHEKRIANEKKKEAEKYLEEAVKRCSEQRQKTAKAVDEADRAANVVERFAENAIEEKEAAQMRKTASEKASATLEALQRKHEDVEPKLRDLEEKYEKASIETEASAIHFQTVKQDAERAGIEFDKQVGAEREKEDIVKGEVAIDYNEEIPNPSDIVVPSEHEGIEKFVTKLEKKRKQLRSAEKAFKKASDAHQWSEKELDEARAVLKQNEDELYKAKIKASLMESRINAKDSEIKNAVASYERYKELMRAAYDAKEEALESHKLLEEKATTYQQAQDYTKKMSIVSPVSPKLSEMTLLHSTKFKYFEKSNVLPFNHMHSLSEGRILQAHEEGDYEVNNLIHFNKTHMTRVFPSKHKIFRAHTNNYNPVQAWSLGCQLAGMNQQICDAFVLVNDGRFRVNGSCGYVLKPESMIERKGGDIRRRAGALLPRQWTIKILSGYNLPKPRKKATSGHINPRVRVTLYDSGHNNPPVVHLTETLKKNGLNPIWDETYGAHFKVKDPNTAMVLFSLWDMDDDSESEDFIAAASIPISCMRQGYRSIPLFDANHMRCGSHGHTMLLARIDAK